MAFVGNTESVRRDIRTEIRRKRDIELKTVPYPSTGLDPNSLKKTQRDALGQIVELGTVQKIIDHFWAPWIDLRDTRLKDWVYPRAMSVHIKLEGFDKEQHPFEPQPLLMDLRGLPMPVCIGKDGDRHWHINVIMDVKDDPRFEEYLNNWTTYKQIEARWIKVENQIVKFVEQCKSLNEAIKLWPDVATYVPQTYLNKIAEKPPAKAKTASTAAEFLKNVDTNIVKASEVAVRLAQSDLSSADDTPKGI